MLVLSRGASEEVRFPKLGISAKVVTISGNRVRLGIDAPKEIEGLRGELVPYPSENGREPVQLPPTTQSDHRLRNRLNAACLSLELAAQQIEQGLHEESLVPLSRCEPPSVVLLDMNMPKVDGRQTLDRIRGEASLCKTRVITLSGLRREGVGVDFGPQGVDQWFQKPVDPKALVAEIERELAITT